MLANKEVCVYNSSKDYSKAELEELIVKFGGQVVQNAGKFIHYQDFCQWD